MPRRLPRDVDHRCLDSVLRHIGCVKLRVRGSHARYSCPSGRVTVPIYKVYSPGLLMKIIAQVGLSREEFLRLYEELC
ncbi:MAG: hypothetical protein DRO39_01510 [Thermoprotei archaeon]|nr:MAG: hypothetical protein DRO39_01510 [Thermoprotei archaeon]